VTRRERERKSPFAWPSGDLLVSNDNESGAAIEEIEIVRANATKGSAMPITGMKSALLAGRLSAIAAAIVATAPAPTPVAAAQSPTQMAQAAQSPCGPSAPDQPGGSPCGPAGASPCGPASGQPTPTPSKP